MVPARPYCRLFLTSCYAMGGAGEAIHIQGGFCNSHSRHSRFRCGMVASGGAGAGWHRCVPVRHSSIIVPCSSWLAGWLVTWLLFSNCSGSPMCPVVEAGVDVYSSARRGKSAYKEPVKTRHDAGRVVEIIESRRIRGFSIMNISLPIPSTVQSVSFSVLTTEDIRRISVKQITNPVLLSTGLSSALHESYV